MPRRATGDPRGYPETARVSQERQAGAGEGAAGIG